MGNPYLNRTDLRWYPKGAQRRFLFFIAALLLAVVIIVVRLSQLMIFTPRASPQDSISFPEIERGPILDRNGRVLALSIRLSSVAAWIPDLIEPEKSAELLAEILSTKTKENIQDRLKNRSGFVFIERKITPTQMERIESLKKEGHLVGIYLVPEFDRMYPQQSLASHVVGYVGVDNIGLDGIEYTFNNVLSPPTVGQELKEAFGNQVFLTLDINIQYFIEKIALQAFKENKADSVHIMVMDAKNGEILGYASFPSFDPNEYNNAPGNALRNLPLTRAYEPGSVFKIISIASFMELGSINLQDQFFCNGFYKKELPGGNSVKIRCIAIHGFVDAQKIIKFSCNAGVAYASDQADEGSFYQLLLRFGFKKPTGVSLPGESAGILAEPRMWSVRTKPTIAFGQEISVSTLQILSAATVFTNDGIRLKPHIVKKVVSPQGELVREFTREPVEKVLSPNVARSVLNMMETATEGGGTARRGRIDGIRVSAKTGTAQVLDSKTGRYSESNFIASFLGIFPTEDPAVIVYVVINHPKGEYYYGSQIAAPVFREVAESLIGYMGIQRDDDLIVEHSGEIRIRLPEKITVGSLMPDLTGIPKRLLLPLLRQDHFDVQIVGNGYVVDQYPRPGNQITSGIIIELKLE